jgi:hypothetical protein
VGSEFLIAEIHPTQEKTHSEIFEENFPFYLAIGMSSAEYWEGDPSLTRYYRKAYKIRQDEINNNAWLQGLYIYDAISTALHNALRGKNSKAKEYAKQPYNFENTEKSEIEKAKEKAALMADLEQSISRELKCSESTTRSCAFAAEEQAERDTQNGLYEALWEETEEAKAEQTNKAIDKNQENLDKTEIDVKSIVYK